MSSHDHMCPYLNGTLKTARCRIENVLIMESSAADIRVCLSLSEHYEYCKILNCHTVKEKPLSAMNP